MNLDAPSGDSKLVEGEDRENKKQSSILDLATDGQSASGVRYSIDTGFRR